MRHYRTLLLLLAVAAVAGGAVLTPPITAGDKKDEPPPAKGDDKPGLHLTIYNDNFALVKDRRELPQELKAGLNVLPFRDVAATLDPTSVHFRSLTDPA